MMKITRREALSGALKTGLFVSLPKTMLGKVAQAGSAGARGVALESVLDKPWVYWFWLNGDVTPEGITHDLEAMARIGISGAIILSSHVGEKGKYQYATPDWFDIVGHAIREAGRLGMCLDFNNGDGWADASGPWVSLEETMRKVVWTETQLKEGSSGPIKLAEPENFRESYTDTAVLAFRTPIGAGGVPEPKVSLEEGPPSFVVHDYGRAVTARSAEVGLWSGKEVPILTPVTWSLEASQDGVTYDEVYRFDNKWRLCDQRVDRILHLSCRFGARTARYFRLRIPYQKELQQEVAKGAKPKVDFTNRFTLAGDDRVAMWEMKGGHFDNSGGALEQPSRYEDSFHNLFAEFGTPAPVVEVGSVIARDAMVDVTAHVSDGVLTWTPPAGEWTVLRVGSTAIGKMNNIATATGKGYYVDRFNGEAMDHHFEHLAQRVVDANRGDAGLMAFHMDSSECGTQNWGPKFAAEFAKRRGYAITPWLPVLAGGHIVGSVEESERFLWDFRRTIADCFADLWWGRLAELCHKNGLQFTGEGAGRMAFMEDPMLFLGKADYPMGEFWIGEMDVRPDCPLSRSTANTMGKKAVFGESFTSATWASDPGAGGWLDHPYSLKRLTDRALVSGVNHFTFHRSISQPNEERPGKALPQIGINMERSNTWWEDGGKAWCGYLRRCQTLLREGREVVDVCVLMDEDVPNYLLRPEGLPEGHRFDGLHSSSLMGARVEKSELVLESGMRYRVMVLPESGLMRPQTLREVARLIEAGAVVAGRKPMRSPSLEAYPKCDEDVRHEVERCWSRKNVFPTVEAAIAGVGLGADFEHDAKDEIQFLHRVGARGDFYFVSNQTEIEQRFEAKFRVGNAAPVFIDADSGAETALGCYRTDAKGTAIDLKLAPRESVFVLLPRGNDAEVVARVSDGDVVFEREGAGVFILGTETVRTQVTSSRGRKAVVEIAPRETIAVKTPWRVEFPTGLGAPNSIQMEKLVALEKHSDKGVRFFSGTATYRTSFDVKGSALGSEESAFLELGDVAVIGEVMLNGVALGVQWKPPFRWDVSKALRMGRNELVVQVTNLWANRLIGDSALPESERIGKTNYNPYKPDSVLPASGLGGPVRVVFGARRKVVWNG